MKRILSTIVKEFGKIEKGTENFYNPQLDYIEQAIYDIYNNNPISDYELQDAIPIIIYDLKGYIDHKIYSYNEIIDKKIITFAHQLEMVFNPLINDDIKMLKKI